MWSLTPRFKSELRKDSHTVAIKAEVLDTGLQPVVGGTFYDSLTARYLKTNQFQNIVIDGNVDVDTERDTQRTFELTILNSNGEFSPNATWGGLFYVNRLVRLWRGLLFNGRPEWVPIGTFMIDAADVIVERNMSTVVLSGSDRWKLLSKALFLNPGSYAAGTNYNTIIRDIAGQVGLSDRELSLDSLPNRSSDDNDLSKDKKYERGDNKGEFLSAMCKKAGIDIWFDPMGILRTQDFNTTGDHKVIWNFYDGDGGMLLSVRRSFNDDTLYNEVQCVGTGNTTTTYVASKALWTGPVGISAIGRRTKVIESRSWNTQAEVNTAVAKYWNDYRYIEEQLQVEVICNPALEGNDVIAIRETKFTDMGNTANETGNTYRITAMSIPLSSSRSKIACKAHRKVD